MNLPETLTDLLLARADSDQSISFLLGHGKYQSVSFAQMFIAAKQRLAQFQVQGLKPSDQLIIQTNELAHFIEALWACLLGGIVAVPIASGNSNEHRLKLFRIARSLQSPGFFTDEQNLTRLSKFADDNDMGEQLAQLQQRQVISTTPQTSLPEARIHQAIASETAFIQFSSGSTSAPKGIVLSHKNLVLNTEAIIEGCQMSRHDHLLSWMPLTHDMGLIGFHLTPLMCNCNHSLMPTDVFVRRPALWLSEASRQKATILCSPNFGYQHVMKSFKPKDHTSLDLSSVRYLFNGAEPISVSLCEQFMDTMTTFGLRTDAMYPVYGLAEASLAVTFPPPDNRFSTMTVKRSSLAPGMRILPTDNASEGVTFVAVGQPVKHVQLQISDANGAPCDEGVTGRICIRGDNVTQGYYNEPDLNAQLFDEQGWLDTGDLGYLHDQQLYITGRVKEIMFVNGQNIYPHDLEEIVFQEGLVERGKLAIASVDEQLIAFVQHRAHADELEQTGKAITALLGSSAGVALQAITPVARIPKTTSGKVQRHALVAEYRSTRPTQASSLEKDTASSSTNDLSDTAAKLLALCNQQVENADIKLNDNLFELGISSLTLAQIHAAIDEQWPERVDITDLFDYPSVEQLAAFLDSACEAS